MGKTTFSGPVRTGKDTGVPATTTLGTMEVVQGVSLASTTSGASTVVLPPNTKINEMQVEVHVPTSASTAADNNMSIRVGNSADLDYFADITVSAKGIYRTGAGINVAAASSKSWLDTGASATQLYIDVTAAGSAADVSKFDAYFTVKYIQKS